MKYRIALADDHQLVLDGLKLILTGQNNWQIVSESNNGEGLLATLHHETIDLVITDLNMPGMRGIDLVKTIKDKFPHVKVLVISMHDEQEIINEILLAEAEGYILKNSGKNEVIQAVNDLIEGKTHYGKTILESMLKTWKITHSENKELKKLSDREKEVLKLILEENTSKEIAEQLNISKQTVDTHRAHIMEKTGAKTLVGLIKIALNSHL
jgi:DNA-binding NarL/FixJ family response regulator